MSVTDEIFADPMSGPDPGELSSLPLTAARSFGTEERTLLTARCRLVFGLGLAISLVLILLSRGVIDRPQLPANALERWELWLDAGHLVSFAIAFGSLFIGKPSVHRLQLTAFAVVAINIVLGVFSMGVISPDYPPALLIALALFIPAAVIPWRSSYQVALGLIGAAAPAVAQVFSYAFMPEAREYWAGRGGQTAFLDQLVVLTVGLLILAATSVLVTRTLYSLRRKAHRARQLGSYIIEKEMGRGGMGQVFVARHARMCRPSAVKVLRASGSLDLDALARFEREVQLSSSLTHPNTITIFDFGRAGQNTFYYAMEYLEGLDLQRLVKRFGPLDPARIVYLLAQVCGSLAEAHGRQIVHRDIKPANIFLTQRGGLFDYVKVLDFGLAKHVDSRDGEGVTQTGLILGTPEYMAPEAIRDEGSVDTRADLYGLGAVAYYLLTGEPPFHSGSAVQTLVDQVRKTPVPPSEITEIDVPVELETIVLRCLEKWPDDRFQSAEQLESALLEVPFEEPWDRNRAREWWSLRTGVTRPVLYESAPRADVLDANV
jgi:hypothetical protein